jgi:hypothetical protein
MLILRVNTSAVRKPVLLALLFLTLTECSIGQANSHSSKGFDYESALAPLRKTLAKAIPGKPDTNTLDACYQIADIFNIRSRTSGDSHDTSYIDSSQQFVLRLIDDSRQLDRPDYEAAAYTIWGQNLISSHADEKAVVEKFLTALTLCDTWLRIHRTPNDQIFERQSIAYANIGYTYFANNEYDNALRYCDSAVRHAWPAYAAGLPLTYKARIYMAQNKLAQAEAALHQALTIMSVQTMTMRWEAMDYLAGLPTQERYRRSPAQIRLPVHPGKCRASAIRTAGTPPAGDPLVPHRRPRPRSPHRRPPRPVQQKDAPEEHRISKEESGDP